MRLHQYALSSASYRVRIAQNLKGIELDIVSVDMAAHEHRSPQFGAKNPQHMLPTLEVGAGSYVSQSMAIIEYLEDCYPKPSLFPLGPTPRARARNYAQILACEAGVLQSKKVQSYLREGAKLSAIGIDSWLHHWLKESMGALESCIARDPLLGEFSMGSVPTIVECFLIPQFYNARRFGIDLSIFKQLSRIDEVCRSLDPFIRAHPNNQRNSKRSIAPYT